MVKRKPRKFDFESALNELEALVERMEVGETSLEESLKDFERGIELTRQCQQALQQAEQKVQILLEKNSTAEPVAFDPGCNPSDSDTANDTGAA